jgi:hypothetical protein
MEPTELIAAFIDPIAPFNVELSIVVGSFDDLSKTLTDCNSHQPLGVFTPDRNFGFFWRGTKQEMVQFAPIADDLRLELAAYLIRRCNPSPALRQLIIGRSLLVRQAFKDNVGDEF